MIYGIYQISIDALLEGFYIEGIPDMTRTSQNGKDKNTENTRDIADRKHPDC